MIKVKVICPECNKERVVFIKPSSSGLCIFCSAKRKGYTGNGFKKGHPDFRKDRTVKSETKLKISIAKKGKPLNLSIEARRKRRDMGFKKGHPNYFLGTGKTSIDKIERIRFRTEIQKNVFKRDNYTCQLCKIKGGRLQVDHIQSWKDYTELRFNMDNCRTLCMDCHYFITYGKTKPKNIVWGHNLSKGGALP